MVVTGASYSCLLIEVGPIVITLYMAASLRSAMAGGLYNVHANHLSNLGFDRTFMPCSWYFLFAVEQRVGYQITWTGSPMSIFCRLAYSAKQTGSHL